jgi:cytochrome c-type biogenesis protein CcmH/NrfG
MHASKAVVVLRRLEQESVRMNAIFLVSAFLMLLIAMSFAATPLLRRARFFSGGFANVPLLAVIAALLLAVGLYAAIGRPDIATNASIPNSSSAVTTRPSAGKADSKAASVSELLAGLEQRLQENPDDGKGWLLLAKSYDHLGRREDAAAAYGRAVELGLSDSDMDVRIR